MNFFKYIFDFIIGKNKVETLYYFLKTIFTLLIAEFFYRKFYGKYEFINLNSYEDLLKYFKSFEFYKPIFCFLLAHSIFYGLIFSLFYYFINRFIENKSRNIIFKLSIEFASIKNKREFITYVNKILGKLKNTFKFFQIKINKDETIDKNDYVEFTKDLYNILCFFIQSIFVIIIYNRILNVYLIIIFLLIFLLIGIFIIGSIIAKHIKFININKLKI